MISFEQMLRGNLFDPMLTVAAHEADALSPFISAFVAKKIGIHHFVALCCQSGKERGMSDREGLDWDYIFFGDEKKSDPKPQETKREGRRPYTVICPDCQCSFPIDGHCPNCGLSYGELFET